MITLRKRASDRLITAYCDAAALVGQAVRITGVEMGTIIVAPVSPTNPEQMPAYGVIVEKLSSTRCAVQRWGDAQIPVSVELEPGKVCYVGLDATLTTKQPVPDAGVFVLQVVGHAIGTSAVDLAPSPATLEISA